MTLPTPLPAVFAAARRRAVARVVAVALPLVLAASVLGWRLAGAPVAIGIAVAALAIVAVFATRARRRLGPRWFARHLDRDPDFEDSADLLFRAPESLGPLQRLQRERLLARLGSGAAPDLRTPWPRRRLIGAWLAGAVLVAAALLWPAPGSRDGADALAPPAAAVRATHTTLQSARLQLQPPAYTGLAVSEQAELSAKVPVGSTLRWSLRLTPQPRAVSLAMHDGTRVALVHDRGHWTGQHVLVRPMLYRIEVDADLPLPDTTLHRLDAVPDLPPQIRVLVPERNLTLRTPGQRHWALQFEASDDHGLGDARLVVTLAKGSGEQVEVSGRTLAVRGEGDGKRRRYTPSLDVAALGLGEGSDLIVRLELADNRLPSPQRARSASLILRWPPPAASESTGMEGLVKRALPAYFRSQRQIIIDAEALVAERRALAADTFESRSDAIGVDQRILRMRYGEFLGEENAGQPDAAGHEEAGHDDEPPTGFGEAFDAMAEYGHTHDDAEAATLLDPETRAILKVALDAMWRSEGELRLAQPERALPHAYRALAAIKQVQQATRIYLARVGLELPPIDEGRRMTGVRAGLGDRRDGLRAAESGDSPALGLWQALASAPVDPAAIEAFASWLVAHESEVDDALGLLAAIEALRVEPACDQCRETLRARLWPLLPAQVAPPAGRAAADAAGRAYLDALSRGDEAP